MIEMNDDFEGDFQDEFTKKMNELINEEVTKRSADKVEELAAAYETIQRLQQSNRSIEAKARTLENDLKNLSINKEKDVRREMFGGFTIGDYVYYESVIADSSLTCDVCGGKRKIPVVIKETGSELEIECRKCGFGGTVTTYKSIPKKDVIRSVHYEFNGRNKWIKFYLDRLDNDKKAEQLFKTEEECQAYCDKKNEERKAKS